MGASKGRFVWYELMTTDPEAGKAFYTETIGWKTQPFEGGPKPYTMFCVGEQPIGGLMELPEEAKAAGAPPNWMGHVAVEDADASAKKVEELGGKIYREPTDIPKVGRFAVVGDPQGAVFSIFQPEGEMPLHEGEPRPGDVSWHELNTTDYEAAWKFYSELFGWKHVDTFDMGPEMGNYWMFDRDGTKGGMSSVAKVHGFPPHWLFYVTVDDIDAAIERVKNGGGEILNGPMEVPGGDKIAQCKDPQGAAFALHCRKK